MDAFLDVATDQFSNREIAAGIWLSGLLVWALRDDKMKRALQALPKAFFKSKVLLVFFVTGLYITFIVLGLYQIGIWNAADHLKDTIIWSVTIVISMLLHSTTVQQEERFFQSAIRDALKLTMVLEFVVGFYAFSLPVELVFVPFMALLGGTLALSETKPEYARVKKMVAGLLAFIGLGLSWYAVQNIFAEAGTWFSLERFIELALPSLLTILFLPFIYFFALTTAYESLFVRLKIFNQDSKLLGYAKRKILLKFGIRMRKLVTWSHRHRNLRFSSKNELHRLLST